MERGVKENLVKERDQPTQRHRSLETAWCVGKRRQTVCPGQNMVCVKRCRRKAGAETRLEIFKATEAVSTYSGVNAGGLLRPERKLTWSDGCMRKRCLATVCTAGSKPFSSLAICRHGSWGSSPTRPERSGPPAPRHTPHEQPRGMRTRAGQYLRENTQDHIPVHQSHDEKAQGIRGRGSMTSALPS